MVRLIFGIHLLLISFFSFGQSNTNIVDVDECINKTLSLSVHVVLDTAEQANITLQDIQITIDSLNAEFAPMCLQFKICNYDTIWESMYDDFNPQLDQQDMGNKYDIRNTINIYYVDTIHQNVQGAEFCGMATAADGTGPPTESTIRDFIAINKACPDDIIHQIGIYFGLYHTYETSFGSELADGSNCATAGDLICDTEADPQGSVNANCEYVQKAQDANGLYYTPPICNIMSHYTHACGQQFTKEQFNRMISIFSSDRSYLW